MNPTTKAAPRRRPNRVKLVELDGSPARPSAESWPAWTDAHRWEPVRDEVIGVDSMGAEVYASDVACPETDAQWLARLQREEAEERARVLAEYQPLPEDLEEYRRWSEALDAGALGPAEARRFEFSPLPPVRVSCFAPAEWDAVRSGQVTEEELSQLAVHGAI